MEVRHFLVILVVWALPECYSLEECKGSEALKLELNHAATKAAKWLTEFLKRNQAQDDFHIDSAAFHSLSLAGFDFTKNVYFQKNISRQDGGRVGLHVNRIIASCQKPSKTLLKLLRHCTETSAVKCGLTHSFQYLTAALALCNSGHSFYGGPKNAAFKRTEQIMNRYSMKSLDTFAMAIITQACMNQRICQSRNDAFCQNNMSNKTLQLLLRKQNKLDGSFGGNGITTALVIQALLIQQVSAERWQCSKAMRYLLKQQKPDGSFGGLMATIQILPVLKGASLSDHDKLKQRCNSKQRSKQRDATAIDNKIRNEMIASLNPDTTTPPTTTNKIMINGDNKVQNVTVKLVVNVTGKFECHYEVTVRNGSSALDVLQSSEKNYTCCDEDLCDQEVSFRAVHSRYGPYVQAIGRYEENTDEHLHWMMYTDDDTLATVGVDSYYPRNATRLVFKFETAE